MFGNYKNNKPMTQYPIPCPRVRVVPERNYNSVLSMWLLMKIARCRVFLQLGKMLILNVYKFEATEINAQGRPKQTGDGETGDAVGTESA